MDRFLIEMTDKPILDYEKSNCLVVRNMRKGKKRDIKRFVANKFNLSKIVYIMI